MGYDIELFVDEVEREFLCSICGLVLKDPLETPCEHFYCRKCIVEWLPISNICPIDRKRIRAVDLQPPNRLLENLLSKLEIKCEFRKWQLVLSSQIFVNCNIKFFFILFLHRETWMPICCKIGKFGQPSGHVQ